ncbi:hypothetical protein EG834_20305, partial [bacterium]|nr:hypothetical protein [bacterium]
IEALAKINTGGEPTGENAHQDVYVTAANDVTTLVIVGALGAGAAGIGGGTDIGVIRNDVTAFIAGSDVRAKNDIVVNALADREIQSYTISAAGGVVGVAAAVSVYVLGGNMDSTYTVSEEVNGNDQETTTTANALTDGNNNSIGGSTETQLAGSGLTDVLAGFITPKDEDSDGEKDAAAGVTQAKATFSSNAPGTPITTATGATVGATSTLGTQTIPRGVSAFIGDGAKISAGGAVDLNARERVKMTLVTGNIAGGVAGIGASITILVLDDNEQAFIGQNANVTAGSDVSLDAGLVEDVYGLAAAGQGGVACLGAQVVVLVDKGDQLAHIDTGAHVHAGGQVKLNASANRT